MAEELNRRQAVRVTDRILLSCRTISPERFKSIAEDYQNGIPLYNQQGLKDIQMYVGAQTALSRLRERDEDLAGFLEHLDTKINAILQQVRGEKTLLDELELVRTNMSGTGMAFPSAQEFQAGDHLEIHIVLLPNYTYIYCIGKVVTCEKEAAEEKNFKVAVEFALLMEDDREKLIHHNFKQQSLALRNRHLNI